MLSGLKEQLSYTLGPPGMGQCDTEMDEWGCGTTWLVRFGPCYLFNARVYIEVISNLKEKCHSRVALKIRRFSFGSGLLLPRYIMFGYFFLAKRPLCAFMHFCGG